MTVFNIRTVRLQSGEQFRDVKEVELEPLELGGQRYLPVPETVPGDLTITRASTSGAGGFATTTSSSTCACNSGKEVLSSSVSPGPVTTKTPETFTPRAPGDRRRR